MLRPTFPITLSDASGKSEVNFDPELVTRGKHKSVCWHHEGRAGEQKDLGSEAQGHGESEGLWHFFVSSHSKGWLWLGSFVKGKEERQLVSEHNGETGRPERGGRWSQGLSS